jgi:molybdopterin synthase catalytic subunit
MNRVKVLFFATLRDRAGLSEAEIEIPQEAEVKLLKERIIAEFPELEEAMDSALISLNREFAFDEDPVPAGAEVALFPPVSGGGTDEYPTILAVTDGEIDFNKMLAGITLPNTGASCVFSGMVRGITTRGEPHETIYLEYEAYKPMAQDKMRQVADEIRQRWPDVQGIAIVQRVGRLYPGTPTVLIGCSAAHRDTGVFEAARYGIDRLKEIVPVWKKEVGSQGEEWVEGEYVPGRDD